MRPGNIELQLSEINITIIVLLTALNFISLTMATETIYCCVIPKMINQNIRLSFLKCFIKLMYKFFAPAI